MPISGHPGFFLEFVPSPACVVAVEKRTHYRSLVGPGHFCSQYFAEIRFIGEVMCGASAVAVLKCLWMWSFGCEFTFIQ